MPTASNRASVEHILRAATTEMGSRSGVCMAPQTRKVCQDYGKLWSETISSDLHTEKISSGVTRTVSQAWRLGRAVALCRKWNNLKNIPASILGVQNGKCLFVGKIIEVQRVCFSPHCALNNPRLIDFCDRRFGRDSPGDQYSSHP